MGAFLTEFGIKEYFTDQLFFKYILNVTGWIHYELPGLFLDNPVGREVNMQLWTVPFELECYVLLILLAVVGLHRKPVAFLSAAIGLSVASLLHLCLTDNLPLIWARPPGRMIVFCFIFGVALFLLKDKIRINLWSFIAAFAIYAILIYSRYGINAAPVFLAYATVYVGIQNKRLPLVRLLADYSYGVYLYGFPMQQVFDYLLPDYRIWWVNFTLSAVATLLFAALSWHLVEKRVNDNKRSILMGIFTLRDSATVRFLSVPAYKRTYDALRLGARKRGWIEH